MKKFIYGLIGFVIFFILAFFILFFFLLLVEEIYEIRIIAGTGARLTVFIMIGAGVLGYHMFAADKLSNSLMSKSVLNLKKKIDLTNKYVRIYLVSWLLYDFFYLIYFFIEKPYGSIIRGEEWLALFSWMFLLPSALGVFVFLYKWALKGK